MNDYLMSVVLGVVEGVTEFLPVSSTAHLRITENLLHISLSDGYWKMYSIIIQLGAILCLPVYFYARIASFLKSFNSASSKIKHPLTLVMIAFCVTALPSFLLIKVIGGNLESLQVIGTALIIGGIVMGAVDLMKAKWEKAGESADATPIHTWKMEDMTLSQAIVVGLCQITSAVFPGTSRSMSTIAGGQMMGLSRAAALEFSFFLSMPTMATATVYTLLKSFMKHSDNPIGVAHLSLHQWLVMGLGFAVSFVIAYGSVAFLMHWVRSRGFMAFAVYRVIIGAIVLLTI